MKRLLLIIALAILPMVSHAQLNVTRQVEKMEQITTSRMGLCRLMKQGDLYYVTLPTTNKYDDPFLFYLGEGTESALQTLSDLIELCGTIEKGSPIVVKNGNESCTISKGMGTLNLRQDGYAGYAEFAKGELQKYSKAIKE